MQQRCDAAPPGQQRKCVWTTHTVWSTTVHLCCLAPVAWSNELLLAVHAFTHHCSSVMEQSSSKAKTGIFTAWFQPSENPPENHLPSVAPQHRTDFDPALSVCFMQYLLYLYFYTILLYLLICNAALNLNYACF